MNHSRQIEVLLVDGDHDHYIVRVNMNCNELKTSGERYVRTDEVRKVERKGRGTETLRVYAKEDDTP